MTYQVWCGTPNQMAKAASKPGQTAAIKWARDHLSGLEKQAEKYDGAALASIRSTKEQMLQTGPIQSGQMRSWKFPYIGIEFRIEIRNTSKETT